VRGREKLDWSEFDFDPDVEGRSYDNDDEDPEVEGSGLDDFGWCGRVLIDDPVDVDAIPGLKRLGKVFKRSCGDLDRYGRVVTGGSGDLDEDPVIDDCGSIPGGQGDNVNGCD